MSDPYYHYDKALTDQINRERFDEADIIMVGDTVVRTMGGLVMMKLVVTGVTDALIICGDWAFSKKTGGEVDLELGWDGINRTGSFIHKERVCDEL